VKECAPTQAPNKMVMMMMMMEEWWNLCLTFIVHDKVEMPPLFQGQILTLK